MKGTQSWALRKAVLACWLCLAAGTAEAESLPEPPTGAEGIAVADRVASLVEAHWIAEDSRFAVIAAAGEVELNRAEPAPLCAEGKTRFSSA